MHLRFIVFILAWTLSAPLIASSHSNGSFMKDAESALSNPAKGAQAVNSLIEKKESLLDLDRKPDFFETIGELQTTLKKGVITPILYLKQSQNVTFDLIFVYLFLFYVAFAFFINHLLQTYVKNIGQSFLTYISLVIVLLLGNTIFYDLSDHYITHPALKLSLKIVIFLFTFMTINRGIRCFLCDAPYSFFHQVTSPKKKVLSSSADVLLHWLDAFIRYGLLVTVILVKTVEYLEYCWDTTSKVCAGFDQKMIPLILKVSLISYLSVFYFRVYTDTLKKMKSATLWLPLLLATVIFFGFDIPLTFEYSNFAHSKVILNAAIILLPFLNLPLYEQIATKFAYHRNHSDVAWVKKSIFKYLLFTITLVVSFRLLVIFNKFDTSLMWFKDVVDDLYSRFISIGTISLISFVLYYKGILAAKRESDKFAKTAEKAVFIKKPPQLVLLLNTIGDIGPIIFWPLYSYLVLIELGLNQVYLSSFYGAVVASVIIGGKDSIGSFFKGLNLTLQGIIVRGTKITVYNYTAGKNESVYGVVEKIFLQSFHLRDEKGLLQIINYGGVKQITFHNEIYDSFSIDVSEKYDVIQIDRLIEQAKEEFKQERKEFIELVNVFKIEKLSAQTIRITYLIKTKAAQVWRIQKDFEEKLNQTLKKNEISYKLNMT